MKTSIIVAAVVLLAAAVHGQQVNCTHTTVDVRTGSIIRYSQLHLITPGGDADFIVPDSDDETFLYTFRICSNTASVCGEEGDTPACQSHGADDFWSLGQLGSMNIIDFPSSDKSRGVVIEYLNGTYCNGTGLPRRVSITLECDPLVGVIAGVSASNHRNDDPCEYEIYARSAYACPDVASNVCDGQVGCDTCTSLTGCGWCAPLQRCLAGNSETPFSVRCNGARNWFFDRETDKCTDCTAITSCSACSAEGDCHFCESSGCQPRSTTCETVECRCDSVCDADQICPSVGGACESVPNTAGLIVGGMFIVIGAGLLAGLGYFIYKKRTSSTNYTDL